MGEIRKAGWRRVLLRSGTVLGLVAASNAAVLTPAAANVGSEMQTFFDDAGYRVPPAHSPAQSPGGAGPFASGAPSITVAKNSSTMCGGPAHTPRVDRKWFSRSVSWCPRPFSGWQLLKSPRSTCPSACSSG